MKEGALQPPTQLLSLFYPPLLHLLPNGALCLRIRCLRPQAREPQIRKTRAEGRAHPKNPLEARKWLLQPRAFYS